MKTFVLDPDRNPGRANLYRIDGRIVVIDYAHNEAGMIGLTEVLHGLKRSGCEVWLAICTAGDRTDRILHGFAFRAAVGSDHLAVAELIHYLRGRSRDDIIERLREGAREAGVEDVPVYADELAALQAMIAEREDRRCGQRHRARDAAGDLRVARGQRRRTPRSDRRPAHREASTIVVEQPSARVTGSLEGFRGCL